MLNLGKNVKNRINRLTNILKTLSSGKFLSTPQLSKELEVSQKIIQTDLKDYLIPLFPDKTIYYDYTSKTYKSKNNFLTKTFLSAEELSIIAILKNKSTDKYSDDDLPLKVNTLFHKYENMLSQSIYSLSDIEKIDTFKKEIIQIQHAIDSKVIIQCKYRDKKREVYPLQIKYLDQFWYLICYDKSNEDIRKYHLNSISEIVEFEKKFEFNEEIIKQFDNAINAWFKPEQEPILVQLFLHERISRYFRRKPVSKTQRIIKEYDNGSLDIELTVTDLMEIIPTIQKFIPHIKVLEPIELKNEIQKNISEFLKDI